MKKISYVTLTTILVIIIIFNTNLKVSWLRYLSIGATLLTYFYLNLRATNEDKAEEAYNLMKRTTYIFWSTFFVILAMVVLTSQILWLKYSILVVIAISYILLLVEAVGEYSVEKEYNVNIHTNPSASTVQNVQENLLKNDTIDAVQQNNEPKNVEQKEIQGIIQIKNLTKVKDKE